MAKTLRKAGAYECDHHPGRAAPLRQPDGAGAKNSVLPILAATLLSGEVCRIRHCPRLRDVETAMEILRHLGCRADWQGRDLLVDAADLTRWDVPDHLMSRMRSSVVFLGAILARCGQAEMTYPGGCELGARPIDLHLAALRSMGRPFRRPADGWPAAGSALPARKSC